MFLQVQIFRIPLDTRLPSCAMPFLGCTSTLTLDHPIEEHASHAILYLEKHAIRCRFLSSVENGSVAKAWLVSKIVRLIEARR
jgi:hypothetical protein